MEPVFSGVGVALVTLFDDDGRVDVPGTADLAGCLAETGLDAFVVGGSTGEAYALEEEERRALLVAVRDVLPDGVALLAGTGAPSARQAIALTRTAAEVGATAALVLSPLRSADPRPSSPTTSPA
jgi:4-hydroxy-tetrahydrodipicolinate synthase